MTRIFFYIIIVIPLTGIAQKKDTSIRKTNWDEYFTHSNDFVVDTTLGIDTVWGKYYVSSSDTSQEDDIPGGYPGVDNIQYGDFDGDGKEEAAMSFYSGGTAGAMSYALFRKNSNGVSLIQWGGGYKLGCSVRNDTLLIYQPEYNAGWEPNCCPSSMWTYFFRLKDNKLVRTDSLHEGLVEMASGAVDHFYELISNKEYEDAYSMLGAKYQLAHPLAKWKSGFDNTISSEATVDTMRISDSTVHITLKAVDRSSNGINTESIFEGSWKVRWYPDNGWLLEEGKIRKVRK